MVKRMDVQSRLLLGGVAGAAGAVWGWLLGFDRLVVVAIAIGAALPAWVLSRLTVGTVQSSNDGLLRSLDELAARPPIDDRLDEGQHIAQVYVLVPRSRQDGAGHERMRPTTPRPPRQRNAG